MAPYRSVDRDETAEAPRDQGIVGDVIAQFADPLAFYRELVQNAIDAGSPSVEVKLTHEAGTLRVRVIDRGSGMTREIVENQLLVLFRSTKEKDPTKIGKFGIGFSSVLAPNPTVVVVHTVRDGKRLTLHLQRDLTYQLFDGGNATQAGTTVELDLAIPAEAAADFASRSYRALVQWCRHAAVPLHFSAEVPGLQAPLVARIDRPLALDDTLLEVQATAPDGTLTVVVGIERTPRTYTGFFNHGLTLFETTGLLVGKHISCKLKDPRLGHTLSRDNVRRDEHFSQAIAFAKELVDTRLRQVAASELRTAAEAGDRERYTAVMHAVLHAELPLSLDEWWVPLACELGGRRAMPISDLPEPIWYVPQPSRLATACSAAGIPVALLSHSDAPDLARALPSRVFQRRLLWLDDWFVHVRPLDLSENDTALVAELAELLRACKREPSRIVLAEVEGNRGVKMAMGGGAEVARFVEADGAYVLAIETAGTPPIGRFARGTLVLWADHTYVEDARQAPDPRIAASHLARLILHGYGQLDPKRSELLLARGLAALGIGGDR